MIAQPHEFLKEESLAWKFNKHSKKITELKVKEIHSPNSEDEDTLPIVILYNDTEEFTIRVTGRGEFIDIHRAFFENNEDFFTFTKEVLYKHIKEYAKTERDKVSQTYNNLIEDADEQLDKFTCLHKDDIVWLSSIQDRNNFCPIIQGFVKEVNLKDNILTVQAGNIKVEYKEIIGSKIRIIRSNWNLGGDYWMSYDKKKLAEFIKKNILREMNPYKEAIKFCDDIINE